MNFLILEKENLNELFFYFYLLLLLLFFSSFAVIFYISSIQLFISFLGFFFKFISTALKDYFSPSVQLLHMKG
jgi:hypothetical protein